MSGTQTHDHHHEKCCSTDDNSSHQDGHDEHDHSHELTKGYFHLFVPAILSFFILVIALTFDYFTHPSWFNGWVRLLWYTSAYIPVGFPVIREAWISIKRTDVFSEFLLMTIATVGAFAIGEYPEGVAVMLFYTVGEAFQTISVSKARGSIQSLIDQRPDEVNVLEDGQFKTIRAINAKIGDIIQLRPGEKVALDGKLLSDKASFNTSALTGESVPDTKHTGEKVFAGMINLTAVCQIQVTNVYSDSKLSKILELVQHASSQKAPTELFIRKFAKVYTPIVVFSAVAICLLPYFFVDDYQFKDWLYRALTFLVISCPCALVISVPLGYFGGIGAASRLGILIKGSNYLDMLASVDTVVMDKTGTVTEGVFKVQEIVFDPTFNVNDILQLVNVIESTSTHPIATAIGDYIGEIDTSILLENIEEIAGHGLKATNNGKELLVGNFKLMNKFNIQHGIDPTSIVYTTIAIAYDNQFVGYITIADSIKENASDTIRRLKELGIKSVMLSGDKTSVVRYVADAIGISEAYGDMLPDNKVEKVKEIKGKGGIVAFVGDGLNDSPVIALSDVGIAMGGLGSDVSIEAADVVIQDDKLSKIPIAITIGKQTKRIVWQNIVLAIGVKLIILTLGAYGIATMWEAVFADVGVALLAIFNAVRIQRMRFN